MTARLLVALLAAALLATHQAAASVGGAVDRSLLSAAAASAQPPSQQAQLVEHQLPSPGTVDAPDAEADGGSVTFHAASQTVTTTNAAGVQQGVFAAPGPGSSSQPPSWAFNAYGMRYTTGPFAQRNAVKEPALAADRRPQPPATTTASSSRVVSEIGSGRPAAAAAEAPKVVPTPRLPVSAEDDSVKLGRSLLQQHAQEHAQPAVDAAGGVAAGLQHWLQPEEVFARPPAARHLDTKRLKQPQAQPSSSLRAAALGLEPGSSSSRHHRTVVRLQQQAQQ